MAGRCPLALRNPDYAPGETNDRLSRKQEKLSVLKHIIERDGSNCVFCGLYCPIELRTVEHFVPVSKDKEMKHNHSNLVLAHQKCNEVAGNLSVQGKVALIIEMRRLVALL